jgi:cupin fold WbuC family metalloprotein
MPDTRVPKLSEQEIQNFLKLADSSTKRRYPKLMHSLGDEFNCAFNFMMGNSYMQPHLHPGVEKIENIHLVRGKVAAFFFDNHGVITKCTMLQKGEIEHIEVPAFTWHTYVMLSDYAVTYETMMGVYEPGTWKKFAAWAPKEGSNACVEYLNLLKRKVINRLKTGQESHIEFSLEGIGISNESGTPDKLNLRTYCRELALLIEPGDIVLIGGLSRSGKTIFARNLKLAILERGCNAWNLSLDRWLIDLDYRQPGVLGRYDLSIIQDVISKHFSGDFEEQILQLPDYNKLEQRTFLTDESILILPSDILIIEGTVSLTLAQKSSHVHRIFIHIDESIRKQRVITEYLSRGKSQYEAEAIYVERQFDETPVVERSAIDAIHVNITSQ